MKRLLLLGALAAALACRIAAPTPGNQPDRLEWFRDQGFGLFIHWSVDSQPGTVISHSLAGASDDDTERLFTQLPKTFSPPLVETAKATRSGSGVKLEAARQSMGDSKSLDVNFAYRSLKRLDANERSGAWQTSPAMKMTAAGDLSATVGAWEAGVPHGFRAVVKHPVLTTYGDSKKVTLP